MTLLYTRQEASLKVLLQCHAWQTTAGALQENWALLRLLNGLIGQYIAIYSYKPGQKPGQKSGQKSGQNLAKNLVKIWSNSGKNLAKNLVKI